MFQTRITELFGVEHPIIMGGMGHVSVAELVAAVANAGGLGFISTIHITNPEDLRTQIRKTRSLTDKPFGVNVTTLPGRPVPADEFIRVILEEQVGAVETAGRSPQEFMERLKKANVKVIHKAGTVRHAVTAQKVGCDAIEALGFEAAGVVLPDDVTLWNLVPRMVDALDIPVVATGATADARQFVAALALGAEGVMMGTRFMATKESNVHQKIKERLVEATEVDTIIIRRNVANANQSRVFRGQGAQRSVELERQGASPGEINAALGSGVTRPPSVETGDIDGQTLTCGQGVGLIHDIPTVKELIDRLLEGAAELCKALGSR